jgi:hypothetical protein
MTDETKDNGGPAFPTHKGQASSQVEGMTLRDYFAAKALPELLRQFHLEPSFNVMERAYKIADLMLKARK